MCSVIKRVSPVSLRKYVENNEEERTERAGPPYMGEHPPIGPKIGFLRGNTRLHSRIGGISK